MDVDGVRMYNDLVVYPPSTTTMPNDFYRYNNNNNNTILRVCGIIIVIIIGTGDQDRIIIETSVFIRDSIRFFIFYYYSMKTGNSALLHGAGCRTNTANSSS